jgi:hypothetical protein
MKKVIKPALSFLLCLHVVFVAAGSPGNLMEAESTLNRLFHRLTPALPDPDKIMVNDSIACQLAQALQMSGSFDYPFDQLKNLGKITSPDKKVRIITWNLPLSDGSCSFFGFVLRKPDNTNDPAVFRLMDKRPEIANPASASCNADNWYGCLVYELIEKKMAGQTVYTLLGYVPGGLFTSQKIIDVLWFDPAQQPRFGMPVFRYNNQTLNRMVFEYSSKAQMSLKYNEKSKMIIFDHLSPSNPSYTGTYQYYGPDFSYDGFRFNKEIWEYVKDLDMRNIH